MASAFQGSGSAMDIQTASMDLMSTMAVCSRPALHPIFFVPMETASTKSGSVMGTMTAGIWVTRRTALLKPFTVPIGSGSALAIASVWIWLQYVMASLTALMGQMNPHFAVSSLTTVYWPSVHSDQQPAVHHHCHNHHVAFEEGISVPLWAQICVGISIMIQINHHWIIFLIKFFALGSVFVLLFM